VALVLRHWPDAAVIGVLLVMNVAFALTEERQAPGKPALAELIVTHLTAARAAAAAVAAKLGLGVVTTRDRPGFLTAAINHPHLNDAARMVQDGYATAANIDTAMMLGCGYPSGPLEMLDDIGPAAVFGVLSGMDASSADPAFGPGAAPGRARRRRNPVPRLNRQGGI
jgi:3-hydroxyacyl-CoA dehydrogenase